MFRFTISLAGLLTLHCTAAGGAIYFAAENPPLPSNAPAEAPLCYKFQDTVSLEEQLGKLKVKYGTALYDEKIVKNEDGSRSLLAKKKDEETGITMEYFYSNNPTVCNEYKKEDSLDECFALKSVFGTCNDECNSSTWTPDEKSSFLEEEHVRSDIFWLKEFFSSWDKEKNGDI